MIIRRIIVSIACLSSLLLSVLPAIAQPLGEAWAVSQGGRLYDNHWNESGNVPPDQPNPAYPVGIRAPVGATWRCVSCHGWDYRGRDGHLAEISKATVFASLRKAAGKKPETLFAAMQAPGHLGNMAGLAKGQIETLALFVSAGQFDAAQLIPSGKAAGNPAAGKDIFEGACVSCHQADGKAYLVGEVGDKPSLGWVAVNRPAQALHKISNGVPGADMLSLRFLPQKRLADLLAYLQTLDDSAD